MKTRDLKRQAEEFALTVSSLPDNIDVGEVVTNLIAGAYTLAEIMPQTGIKAGSTEQLNILDTAVTWSAGDCVATETGDNTTIVPRNLTTTRLTDRELLCLDVLSAKLPMYLSAGAREEDFDFASTFIDYKVKQNANQLEKLVWQGNTSTGSGNLSLVDGFLKLAADESGSLAYTATYGAGDLSGVGSFSADPIAVMELINTNMTAELDERDDFCVWMSLANFKALAKDIRDTYAGAFQATGDYLNAGQQNQEGWMELIFPGTNIRVKGTHGFGSEDKIFATYKANLRYGTDLENDKEEVELFYDKYHKEMVSDIVFSIGFQYQEAGQVILITD
jgi:hypothetical protein